MSLTLAMMSPPQHLLTAPATAGGLLDLPTEILVHIISCSSLLRPHLCNSLEEGEPSGLTSHHYHSS